MRKTIFLALAMLLATTSVVRADELSSLQAAVDALKAQVDALNARIDQLSKAKPAPPPPALPGTPVMLKRGDGYTFLLGGEEVTLYGNLDISADITTKGLQPFYASSGDSPVGNVGYLPALSTNLSYLGVRGQHKLGPNSYIPYQLETQLDVTATAGTVNSNSNNDTIVKGALTSRNSFIGVGNKYVGALKLGKTDAPYKTSTARMNPFSGEIGDYAVVMGNTGGDNRVEFGTRMDHSIWYESRNMGGLTFNAFVSPGQNRATDNSLIAAGESSCAGGNAPGSGALSPACNDGAWGAAYSANVAYQKGPFYGTVAWELHKKVNRVSDLAIADPNDVVDEYAMKYGIQYIFGGWTTVSAIYENMKRDVPAYLQYQNERSRDGFWLAVTQRLTKKGDTFNVGWARANPTPGDPGQHNTSGGANPDNMANMFTAAFKHNLDRNTLWYVAWAMTANHPAAHYDLGAGGRGVTTDCHDGSQLAAFDPTTGLVSGAGPHCYAGGQIRGFSTGIDVRF